MPFQPPLVEPPLFEFAAAALGTIARLLGLLTPLSGQWAQRTFSWRWKLAIAGVGTLLLLPVVAPLNLAPPQHATHALAWGATEFLYGCAMGVGVQLMLWGITVAGQLTSQIAGQAMPAVLTGADSDPVSPLTRFLDVFAFAGLLTFGGHRWVVTGVLDSFVRQPIGTLAVSTDIGLSLGSLMTASLHVGLMTVLPLLCVLVSSNLLSAMVARVVPSLQVLAATGGLNALLMLAVLMVTLGSSLWALESGMAPLVEQWVQTWKG